MKGNVEVIIKDIKHHPRCAHGPTVLFSRKIKGKVRRYFACSACRDRKQCNFFLDEDKAVNTKGAVSDLKLNNLKKGINHRKMFIKLNEILNTKSNRRLYCIDCNKLCTDIEKHKSHTNISALTNFQLKHPTEILAPLDNSKKEAQYHFSKSSIEAIMNIFHSLDYKNIICIGTPKVHEYIKENCKDLSSILLDIDKRLHNFFGPLEFCWYNMFNHYFFFPSAEDVFKTFLRSNRGVGMALITDPPFGGRTELLSTTFNKINEEYKKVNSIKDDLPIFWIYPYFMEPHIINSLKDFSMLDYKIDYENHKTFQNNSNRKQGSPVRIFTNVNQNLIRLPSTGYKYCKICDRWTAEENIHCKLCKSCPSKNGATYIHCKICSRCVKPNWRHCQKCKRCAQVDHECNTLEFKKQCFNCKEVGHKKDNCSLFSKDNLKRKTLSDNYTKKKKKHQ